MEYISTVEPIEHWVELFWRKMQQRTPDTHSIPGTGSIVLGMPQLAGTTAGFGASPRHIMEKMPDNLWWGGYPLILRGFPSDTYLLGELTIGISYT